MRNRLTYHDTITITRHDSGVPVARATDWTDAWYAFGYLHGRDRGMQVLLTRLIAQGRLCECLRDDEATFAVDRYFRRVGFMRDAAAHIGALEGVYRERLDAYCAGLNAALRHRLFLPLRLTGYKPEAITPADILAMLKLASFGGLAEGQRVGELFVIQAIRRGVEPDQLAELFPELGAIDVELIRNLEYVPPFHPGPGIGAGGSNAWAVAGARSASGAPLLCNDTHLEVNRLPAMFHELQLDVGDTWVKGASLPGLPGFITGRTPSLAWGVTYSCADTADFFIERCRDNRCQRDAGWRDFTVHRELIRRKQHDDYTLNVFETDCGLLESDPRTGGDHLCWQWSGRGDAGVDAIRAYADLPRCTSVAEGQATMRDASMPTLHVLFADRAGHIGYQFVGRVPRRADDWNGMAPRPAWETGNHWHGWLDAESELPSFTDPADGFIASANEARSCAGGPTLVNLPLAGYRHRRIQQALRNADKITVTAMQSLQYDLLSLEARTLLPVYLPHVPPGPQHDLLRDWDHRYSADSRAATLFENIHHAVIIEVLGSGGLGRDWIRKLMHDTSLTVVLAGFIDDLLNRADSHWLPAATRDAILRRGVQAGMVEPVMRWGERNQVLFKHLLLGGKLPAWTGVDRGPYPLPGSHATISQGAMFHAGTRLTSFAPSYRFIADLAGDEVHSNLPGGASESPWSRYYADDLKRWLERVFKAY